MQTVGRSCGACGRKIAVAKEATWCSRCGTAYHSRCLAAAELTCGACGSEYAPPSESDLAAAMGMGRALRTWPLMVSILLEGAAGLALALLPLLCWYWLYAVLAVFACLRIETFIVAVATVFLPPASGIILMVHANRRWKRRRGPAW